MRESNIVAMRRHRNNQMGSAWTDFRNSAEDQIVAAAGNLFPSKQASPPPATIARPPATIAGLSMTTVGILGIGALVVWKLLHRKK